MRWHILSNLNKVAVVTTTALSNCCSDLTSIWSRYYLKARRFPGRFFKIILKLSITYAPADSQITKEELIPGLYQTLFSLLYSTGMRISEALGLTHADYINDEKLIHIQKGKFRKERYIVVSNSAANRLNEYIQHYTCTLPIEEDSALFIDIRTKPLTYSSAYGAFVKTLNKSGIVKNHRGPRLHDFRHAFAIQRLLQWYQTEQDINAKLPFLSTYMGHVNISSTHIYFFLITSNKAEAVRQEPGLLVHCGQIRAIPLK
jgi:integrase